MSKAIESNHVSPIITQVKARLSYLQQPNGPHRYHDGIHAEGRDCGPCSEMWSLSYVLQALDLPAYCGDCDGVGWVEGGLAIQTECSRCRGTGWEPIRWTAYPERA